MTLLEAIRQAGPGGVIYQGNMKGPASEYYTDDFIQLPPKEDADGSELGYLSWDSILATDWEARAKKREVWIPEGQWQGKDHTPRVFFSEEEARRNVQSCECRVVRFVEADSE